MTKEGEVEEHASRRLVWEKCGTVMASGRAW